MLKKILVGIGLLAMISPQLAMAADFTFHGDMDHRFLVYTNQAQFFQNNDLDEAVLDDGDIPESFASIKYRLWTEASSVDGNIKGVYAIELGAVRFGRESRGGGFSGDGVNIETRWAYTDFQLPGIKDKARVRIGLQPFEANRYLWDETVTGVRFATDNFQLAWMRGLETINDDSDDDWGDGDNDALFGRYGYRNDTVNAGIFALYQRQGTSSEPPVDISSANYEIKEFGSGLGMDLVSIGTDGALTRPTSFGNAFLNWDLLYQTGNIRNVTFTDDLNGVSATGKFDVSAWFGHADVGVNAGRNRYTYMVWYASGDDDPSDQDFDAFLATDVDMNASIIFFEGGYTNDFYFTERPYLFDKGLFLQKIAIDRKATDKLAMGVSGLYLITAEDFEYTDGSGIARSEDQLGFEIDGYVSYKLYPNVTVSLNAGYLFSGDAMDVFDTDVDGKADTDVYRSTMNVRYKF